MRKNGFQFAKHFTTGQVAEICQVASRTVSQWFDSGSLKGYRFPDNSHRYIPRESLIEFLERCGAGSLIDGVRCRILLIGCEQSLVESLPCCFDSHLFGFKTAETPFQAGLIAGTWFPTITILDASLGVQAIREIMDGTKCKIVILGNEDGSTKEAFQDGLPSHAKLFAKPFPASEMVETIKDVDAKRA